ncbi:MAG: ATP synthase F1 subunit epsilon [Fimbriimonadaceae bacterium]|nr:ATP synthase F1 subunit epsilon [Fimbriimonadaceae bacterium]
MAAFQLSIVAPDRTVFDEPVDSLTVPAVEGYMGILSHHEPIIAALTAGVVEVKAGPSVQHVAITGGFLESSDNKVIILADDAVRATDVDVAEEEKILEEARRSLRGEGGSMNATEAKEALRKAMVRIRSARRNS